MKLPSGGHHWTSLMISIGSGKAWCCQAMLTQFYVAIYGITRPQWINTLRPRQNGRHLADDIFKGIFLNKNVWIPIKFSLKFVPNGPINNIPALVQIMAWRRPGDKPLSEPLVVRLPTHICVTRPQWVNSFCPECILRCLKYISNNFSKQRWYV